VTAANTFRRHRHRDPTRGRSRLVRCRAVQVEMLRVVASARNRACVNVFDSLTVALVQ
jgi:hypothetical protein